VKYLEYWELADEPFENTRNTKFFFPSHNHVEAFERLLYVTRNRNMNFGLLTGEIGSGKTITKTILERQLLKEGFEVVSIENSGFSFFNILIEIISQLKYYKAEIKENDEYSALKLLKKYLVNIVIENNRHLVILLDEAQQLERGCLDKIKNLTNICSEVENYMSIILIGQPELKLLIRSLPQVDQRVTLKYHLKHLPKKEVKDYICHRLKVAGCDNNALFTDEAIELINNSTDGIPREINRICRLALDTAFSRNDRHVSKSVVSAIVKDINLQGSTSEDLGKINSLYYKSPKSGTLPQSENGYEKQSINKSSSNFIKTVVLGDSLSEDSFIYKDLVAVGSSVTLMNKQQGYNKNIFELFGMIILVMNFYNAEDRELFHHFIKSKKNSDLPVLIMIDHPLSKSIQGKLGKIVKIAGANILFSPVQAGEFDHKIKTLLEGN